MRATLGIVLGFSVAAAARADTFLFRCIPFGASATCDQAMRNVVVDVEPSARGALFTFRNNMPSGNARIDAVYFDDGALLALAEIILLWFLVGITTLRFFSLKPLSGIMMAPYWLWTSFAAVLNASIWWLNRG